MAARALTPNPSFNLTRYGRHGEPGRRYSVHCLGPALQYLPPRAVSPEPQASENLCRMRAFL